MPFDEGLQLFLRTNRTAWQFAWKASDDYLLARTGMLNGLWSAFEMATQSVEKLLKSYLLFVDLGLSGSAEAVRRAVSAEARKLGRTTELGHDVRAALMLVRDLGLPCSKELEAWLGQVNGYYGQRYPDEGGPMGLDCRDFKNLDEAVFEIWDAFKAVYADYYYTCGIMTPVYGFLVSPSELSQQYFRLMTDQNESFEVRRADIEGGIRARIAGRLQPRVNG